LIIILKTKTDFDLRREMYISSNTTVHLYVIK
jgi:hypothetical protein